MNRKRDVRAMVVLLLVIILGMFVMPDRRADAMTPEDILALRTATPVDLAPDGRFLLYTVGVWNEKTERRELSLHRRDLQTGKDLLLFSPEDQGWGAVWRPDGQAIAYLRRVEGAVELWQMDADGSDRHRLDTAGGDFGALLWAPDASALAWVATTAVGLYDGDPGRYVVADGIGYRHLGEGYREGRLGQLFVLELADGATHRLVDAAMDVRSAAWSPDGATLVFCAKAERDLGWNLNTDLWVVPRAGGTARRLTANPGPDKDPLWLPDGRIAYLRAVDPLWESSPQAVAIIGAKADLVYDDAGKKIKLTNFRP